MNILYQCQICGKRTIKPICYGCMEKRYALKTKQTRKKYIKEYNQRPEVKQRLKEYNKLPEIIEHKRQIQHDWWKKNRLKYIDHRREYDNAYSKRPEVIERRRENQRRYYQKNKKKK